MYSKRILLLTAALLLLGSVTITPTLFANSTTLTVTGYGDFPDLNPGDGACDTIATLPGNQCSLRAAIEELNALGPDTTPHNIEFNISGTGPFTITPASPLPAITVPLVIGGQTQPGASCPTPNASANLMIVLDGSNAGTGAVGLVLQSGSDDSTIRGLVIGNFDLSGIRVFSNNNKVRCSHIGLGANGIANIGNHYGITLYGEGNTIGGQLSSSQRNVISGNQSGVLLATGSHNNEVLNNFIGTTATGASELGNSYAGIYVAGDNNLIGGATENRRNVISGNELGIHILGGQNNIIFGNYIGVASDGVTPLPNVFGIALIGETNANVVGGTAGGEANLIAYNSALGVYLVDYSGEIPVENEIRGNTIFANDSLAIDLGANGIDTNDPGDGDFGENESQNYPELAATPGTFFVNAALDSQANTQYTIDFYRNDNCDPSGYGEGQEYLTTTQLNTNSSGHGSFTILLNAALPGDSITATATDPNGNTSEFSACVLLNFDPTATPTPTPGPSSTPTSTATEGPSPTPTATATEGPSPTPTATATPGPSPTPTATATNGPSPTPTHTATPGPSPTPTATATNGPSPTPTHTATPGPSPTPTATATDGPSPTPTTTPPPSPTLDPAADPTHHLYLPGVIHSNP